MDKIRNSRLKSTELLAGGTAEDMRGASLASLPSGSQQRRDVHTVRGTGLQRKTSFVPVVDNNQQPLMPTTSARARKWIKSGKATSFWKKGIFCVRLNQDIENIKIQPIAVGIDPGS